jgi:hypothetical protein
VRGYQLVLDVLVSMILSYRLMKRSISETSQFLEIGGSLGFSNSWTLMCLSSSNIMLWRMINTHMMVFKYLGTPQPKWILNDPKFGSQDTKHPLHILPSRLLCCCKCLIFVIHGMTLGFNKSSPFSVIFVCQVVPHVVVMIIDREVNTYAVC